MHPATAFASISSSARAAASAAIRNFVSITECSRRVYSDLPYETAPLAADGFHLRILKVPAADLRPSQADLVKAGLGDLVPKPFSEHGALVPLLASCFRDLKETDDASEPERARSLVQALAQLALIERGLIRPGSRVALHALRRRPLVAGPAIDCSQHLADSTFPGVGGGSARDFRSSPAHPVRSHRHQLCPDRDRRAPRRKPPATDPAPGSSRFRISLLPADLTVSRRSIGRSRRPTACRRASSGQRKVAHGLQLQR